MVGGVLGCTRAATRERGVFTPLVDTGLTGLSSTQHPGRHPGRISMVLDGLHEAGQVLLRSVCFVYRLFGVEVT
jgi:hypothetical protein